MALSAVSFGPSPATRLAIFVNFQIILCKKNVSLPLEENNFCYLDILSIINEYNYIQIKPGLEASVSGSKEHWPVTFSS